MDNVLRSVPGKRPATLRFLHAGYSYHIDPIVLGHTTYRCATRSTTRCRGTIQVRANEIVEVVEAHSHPRNSHLAEEAQLRMEVLQLCRVTLRSFDDIFTDVSLGYPQAAVNVTLRSMRSAMKRERNRRLMRIPDVLADLHPGLWNYDVTRDIYRGIVRGTDGSVGLMFGHLQMLQRLNAATEIFVDATFRVVPRRPRAMQLLIIHFRSLDVAFTVLYVLCSRKTQELYVAVWQFLLNVAPALRRNLRTVISDYEQAIIASVRQVFPAIAIRGCWFHYCQALARRWRKLNLRGVCRNVLWMCMSLALVVPTTRFLEGLDSITAIGNVIVPEYPAIAQFLAYMRRQWLPLASVVSVGRSTLRTNNTCESFNRHIVGRLGGSHPNFWVFLEKLERLIAHEEINWQRVHGGHQITEHRSAEQQLEDERILVLQDDLATGNMPMIDFLRAIMEYRRRNGLPNDVD